MRYLLDTHVLIFLGTGDVDRIGKEALKAYRDPDTRVYVSQISFWEIAIKANTGTDRFEERNGKLPSGRD